MGTDKEGAESRASIREISAHLWSTSSNTNDQHTQGRPPEAEARINALRLGLL
jgi:hypothetical protein